MSENEQEQKRSKISQQKGKEYEKFVSEVYNYYNSLLQNKEGYRIERNKDKDNGEIDIYFEYKLPNGMNKTLIECKYGKFEKKDMFAFISKMADKGGNMHGIFVYNDEKYLTDGIKELAERNNIELRHIIMESGCIEIILEEWIQMDLILPKNSHSFNLNLIPFDEDNKIYILRRKPSEMLDKNSKLLVSKEKYNSLYNDMCKIVNDEKFIKRFAECLKKKNILPMFNSSLLDKDKTECFIYNNGSNDENAIRYYVLVKYIIRSKDDVSMSLKIEDKEFCFIRKPLEEKN